MLPDVPLLTELAKTEEQRQILTLISAPTLLGQPYLAPPAVPRRSRRDLARGVRVDDARSGLPRRHQAGCPTTPLPLTGEEVARFVHQTVTAPPDIVAKARAVIGSS